MVLKSVSNLPPTPGRQVRYLKTELEKTNAENEALRDELASMTKALASISLVKESAADAPAPADGNKKKVKKDPNAPKSAVTAYKYFCEDIRAAEGEDAMTGKELQQMWKECQGDARQKYVDMAAEDKKRFEKEDKEYKALQELYKQRENEEAMQVYEAHKIAVQAVAEKDASKKKKAKKDPDAPKRACSAYMHFCNDKRTELTSANPDKSPVEVTKILGEEWNKLEKGKRGKNGTKKYDDLAAKDKKRYDAEKAAYDAKKEEEQKKVKEEEMIQLEKDREEARKMVEEQDQREAAVHAEAAKAAKKAIKAEKAVKEDKPKGPKRATSAYNFFVRENHDKIKASMPEGSTFAEISAEVGKQWGKLSDKKKKPFEKLAEKDKERYQKELEAMSK